MSSTIDTGGPKDYTPMENEYAQHAARAKLEVETLSAEAKKRFLSLVEVGVGGGNWCLMDSQGRKVFPQFRGGESLAYIRGFFSQNPQA